MKRGRLYRSRRERVIAGVAGGLADYFEIDVILVGLLWIIAFFMDGGFLAYLLAWLIIPEQPADLPEEAETTITIEDEAEVQKSQEERWRIGGLILIFFGLIFLFRALIPWHTFRDLVPILLIVLGMVILIRGFRR
mgnify:CR=1 FL=1